MNAHRQDTRPGRHEGKQDAMDGFERGWAHGNDGDRRNCITSTRHGVASLLQGYDRDRGTYYPYHLSTRKCGCVIQGNHHISRFYSPTCQSSSNCASSFATVGRSAASRRHNGACCYLVTFTPSHQYPADPSLGLLQRVWRISAKGTHKRYRTCDIAFEHFHSSHLSFLLLTKAIIVFMVGEHPDAISRLDDLIATIRSNSLCYTVQAYMYLLGNSQIERNDYEGAMHSFARARAQMQGDVGPPIFAISLTSGWEFDDLDILIRQRLCEALYALGRTMELLWTKKSTSGFLTLPNNVSRASKTLVSQLRTHSSMVIRRYSTLISIYRPPFRS
ncbi:hypothetical protein EV363DRAFT_1345710 [Boletus edulis]|nr:hypothetical protein EV363DRAFT_1345710 [Boletus edulis]